MPVFGPPAWGVDIQARTASFDCSILLCNEIGNFLLKDKAKTLEHYVKKNTVWSTKADFTEFVDKDNNKFVDAVS